MTGQTGVQRTRTSLSNGAVLRELSEEFSALASRIDTDKLASVIAWASGDVPYLALQVSFVCPGYLPVAAKILDMTEISKKGSGILRYEASRTSTKGLKYDLYLFG